MKLDYWEMDYIHNSMKNYDIKFQEIYNELFDHIVTAIEERRTSGDTNSLEQMYAGVVKIQFGGYSGIEKIAKSHEDGYKRKVRKMIWANFRHYINFQSLVFIIALMCIGFSLPHTKLIMGIFFIAIFAAAAYSSLYAYIKLRAIKPKGGKISLVYSHTITQANFPLIFLNALLWVPQLPNIFSDNYKFSILDIYYPAILALLLALMIIYNLSCMRLCRQELEQFVNINPDAV
jgi:hypothetical protein